MDQWTLYYRTLSAEALDAEIVWLQRQIRNPFGSQTEGNRAVSRSTAEFRDRIAAASQVKQENGGADMNRHLVADFSQVQL